MHLRSGLFCFAVSRPAESVQPLHDQNTNPFTVAVRSVQEHDHRDVAPVRSRKSLAWSAERTEAYSGVTLRCRFPLPTAGCSIWHLAPVVKTPGQFFVCYRTDRLINQRETGGVELVPPNKDRTLAL